MEQTILSNLMHNVEYVRKVLPHLKDEYFATDERFLFKMIKGYITTYKKLPTKNALTVKMESYNHSPEYQEEIQSFIDELIEAPDDLEWLVDVTEEYCKEKALNIAISKSIVINDNALLPVEKRDSKVQTVGHIPEILSEALGICFDASVGHDYFDDYEYRFEKYHIKEDKIPFRIRLLNLITKGGVSRKTLNVLLMGVNVGKTLGLCNLASDYILSGYNVLYITMEMDETEISKRIDANLLDIGLDDLMDMDKSDFGGKMDLLRGKTNGKLIVKQFPTAGANVNHFTSLLGELRLKKSIYPDVVIVDYLGICASSRITGGMENTYVLVKAIAEELRGFAVENNIAVWSAAQTTRSAWGASDIEMGDTAESAGLPATCDFLLGGLETDETIEQGQQLFKQLKSRYGDKNYYNKFMLNVNKSKQRWEDVDDDGFTPTQNKMDKAKNDDKKSKIASISF